MLLLIDNYDSFTYNLYQYFCELGAEVLVKRNDAITLTDIEVLTPTHLVISPGPCTPNYAGISLATIRHFADKLPILGVCLGHQAIGQAFGARVVPAHQVMHGKTSVIQHTGSGVFSGLALPLTVTRYHSLVIDPASLPAEFDVTAWTEREGERDEIMGIRHCTLPLAGVQFHPESILSEQGHQLLQNFLNTLDYQNRLR
ncbi:MAG: aminodeoxychorismate synthase component II [Symbiopectobacterium sp.]